MANRKSVYDSLVVKYPPGSVLPESTDSQQMASQELDRQASMTAAKRKVKKPRREPRRMSIVTGIQSTFGATMVEPSLGSLAESAARSTAHVERQMKGYESPPPVEPVYEPDYNIMSEKVLSLDTSNFDHFTKSKEKALVLFYKNFQMPMAELEANFASVAEESMNVKHGFGAVDCVQNRELCAREKICVAPEVKLFSNGFELGNSVKAKDMSAAQMSMMVKMTPVLHAPRPAGDLNRKQRTTALW